MSSDRARQFQPALVLLVLMASLLMGLQAIEPRFFLRDDNVTHFLPAYEYAYETVTGGELPLLNHHQMFGGTFLASGQTGVFLLTLYPVRALLGLLGLDPVHLIDVLASLHFLLAGLGMWILLRHLGFRQSLALPLALCWCFLPFGIVTARSWIFVSYLLAYLPFNQWLLQRFLAEPSARGLLGLAVVKTCFFFTGYLHYAILAVFFEGCFLIVYFLLAKRDTLLGRRLAGLGAVYVLAALFAAPLLVPVWNAKELSYERSRPMPKEVALASAIQPAELGAANLFIADGTILSDLSNAVFFLGPLWLAGLAGAAWRLRRPPAWRAGPAAAAGLLTGVFALMMCTALFRWLAILPVFEVLRWPFKGFPIAAFYLFLPLAETLRSGTADEARRSRPLAGLAWANLVLQLLVLLPPTWRAPISPWVFEGTVAELRSAPLLAPIGSDGRVALLSSGASAPRATPLAQNLLFPTLAKKYGVQGYDPLVARINVELISSMASSMPGLPAAGKSGWPAIPHLPRYLIVDATSELVPVLAATPGVRQLIGDQGFALFENGHALPIVSWVERQQSLPFRWRANGVELDLPADFSGGHLLVDVAGLDGYRFFLNGQTMGAPELVLQRPLLALPPGGGRVELRYVDRGLQVGLLLCGSGLGLVLRVRRRGDAWLRLP